MTCILSLVVPADLRQCCLSTQVKFAWRSLVSLRSRDPVSPRHGCAAQKGLELNIVHAAARRSDEATASMQVAYTTLLEVNQRLLEQAQQVSSALRQRATQPAQRLADQLMTLVPRLQQVMRQTQRRVLEGESVPARDKLVSLFEPHTAIIRKGKVGKDVEFGRLVHFPHRYTSLRQWFGYFH